MSQLRYMRRQRRSLFLDGIGRKDQPTKLQFQERNIPQNCQLGFSLRQSGVVALNCNAGAKLAGQGPECTTHMLAPSQKLQKKGSKRKI